MSLDVSLTVTKPVEVFSANVTHNLTTMAEAAGLYGPMWRPEEHGIKTARDLVGVLREGLARLVSDPGHFRAFNPENGWGSYEGLVEVVRGYLAACEENPDAEVRAFR